MVILAGLIAASVGIVGAAEQANLTQGAAPPGALKTDTLANVAAGFLDPDLFYAPYCFWFWDEPLDPASYPAKPRDMAKRMLEQRINPGYAHARVSMADLLGPSAMSPSPSLPKTQWLSDSWFESFSAALGAAESGGGYLGYVDEYMWPSGRAADRVIQQHPELASASLDWAVLDVQGGEAIELPPSFFTVAAKIDGETPESDFYIPAATETFELRDLTGVDLFGHTSLGQTVTVDRERLVSISMPIPCFRQAANTAIAVEVREGGAERRVIASRSFDGLRNGAQIVIDIPEALPVGTVLYVGIIPGEGLTRDELGWWSKPAEAYAGGRAYTDGKPVDGARYLRMAYLSRPDLMQGQWIWHPQTVQAANTRYFRKSFDLPASALHARIRVTADNRYALFLNGSRVGEGTDWSKPGTYDVATLLVPGQNVVAVEGGGEGGLDALLLDLEVGLPAGQTIAVRSDKTWRTTSEREEGWLAPRFDDTGWALAKEFGPAGGAPWNLAAARGPYRNAVVLSDTLRLIGEGDSFSWTAPAHERWRVYTFRKSVGGDVNCIDDRLAAAFIDIAHKPYADRFGPQMGRTIPGVFCDTEGSYGGGLAWSDSLPPRYLANTGRDLRLWMPLMLDTDREGRYARARFDWFDAVSDLYAGYFSDISRWLAKLGMYHTGHTWEDSLLSQTCCVSDFMKVQRGWSMPGMDSLELRAYDVHDFKETQSVAEFEGRRYLCEILGAGGWRTFNPITMKENANAAAAWGVSHFSHHAVFMSRRLDGNVWVPDWYDENPMWPYMHLWADFVRRVSYVNSNGRVVPDVLLINPIESIWTILGPGAAAWGPEKGDVRLLQGLFDRKAQRIDETYSDAIRQLTAHRIEYLIADRHYMRQMQVQNGRLLRGEFIFKAIVLPPLLVLPIHTARTLVEFAQTGGHVYVLGELPEGSTDLGMGDPAMKALMDALSALPSVQFCKDGLKNELQRGATGLRSPIEFVSGGFPMLESRRKIDRRDFFWLANNSANAQSCELRALGVRGAAAIWNCETGEIRPVASIEEEAGSRVKLTFQPHEGYFLTFDPGAPARSDPEPTPPSDEVISRAEGDWLVRIDPSAQPNLEHPVKLPSAWTTPTGAAHELTPWDTWGELPANFSGSLDYTKTLDLPGLQGELVLDLGEVNHFAEVWVNGEHVGAKLWPPYKFQTAAFHPGKNNVRIRVGNLVNNNYGVESSSGLLGPVELRRP